MLLHLGLNVITLRTFITLRTSYYTCAFNMVVMMMTMMMMVMMMMMMIARIMVIMMMMVIMVMMMKMMIMAWLWCDDNGEGDDDFHDGHFFRKRPTSWSLRTTPWTQVPQTTYRSTKSEVPAVLCCWTSKKRPNCQTTCSILTYWTTR